MQPSNECGKITKRCAAMHKQYISHLQWIKIQLFVFVTWSVIHSAIEQEHRATFYKERWSFLFFWKVGGCGYIIKLQKESAILSKRQKSWECHSCKHRSTKFVSSFNSVHQTALAVNRNPRNAASKLFKVRTYLNPVETPLFTLSPLLRAERKSPHNGKDKVWKFFLLYRQRKLLCFYFMCEFQRAVGEETRAREINKMCLQMNGKENFGEQCLPTDPAYAQWKQWREASFGRAWRGELSLAAPTECVWTWQAPC